MGEPLSILSTIGLWIAKIFKININVNYEKKDIELILRIEHNNFDVCIPLQIKRKSLGIIPVHTFVHRTASDNWDVKNLW